MGMEMKAHSKNGGIIMDASSRCRLIHSQIFHFRCTKDDILIWFLNWRNEFGWRPANVIGSVSCWYTQARAEKCGQKEGNGKIHMGLCALGLLSL